MRLRVVRTLAVLGLAAAFGLAANAPVHAQPAADEASEAVDLTAEIFDLRGEKVRTLYSGQRRVASAPGVPELDCWDGRDERGGLVPGGVYILRLVIEPDADRVTRAFTVVR